MPETIDLRRAAAWVLAALLFALGNALTLGNPGYFSHDELQWGGLATVESMAALPFVAWSDYTAFQYRPLTFNLWLLLSYWLFAHPALFHTAFLVLAFGVCALLYLALRRAAVPLRPALAASAAFAFNPYALYVHGWVATLGELLWSACAIGLSGLVLAAERGAWRMPAAAAALLTTIALLSKEAALSICVLLTLAWWLSGFERRWTGALLGSLLPTLVYLWLRLPVLMSARGAEQAYDWSLAAIPLRWAEMQLYPFLPTALELASVAHASAGRIAIAAAVATLLLLCVFRAGARLGALYVLGGLAAIGPALLLHQGYPQYGYAFSALACACLAMAWVRLRRGGRVVLGVALLLCVWHGVNVQREMRRIGELQSRFTPSLRAASDAVPDGGLRLRLERTADAWIYRRLALPEASDDASAPQLRFVVDRADASHIVVADGSVRAR